MVIENEISDLIKALQILLKYAYSDWSIYCNDERDEIFIRGIRPDDISDQDFELLLKLEFFASEDGECFIGPWQGPMPRGQLWELLR